MDKVSYKFKFRQHFIYPLGAACTILILKCTRVMGENFEKHVYRVGSQMVAWRDLGDHLWVLFIQKKC